MTIDDDRDPDFAPVHPDDPTVMVHAGHNTRLGVVMLKVGEKVFYMSPNHAEGFARELMDHARQARSTHGT